MGHLILFDWLYHMLLFSDYLGNVERQRIPVKVRCCNMKLRLVLRELTNLLGNHPYVALSHSYPIEVHKSWVHEWNKISLVTLHLHSTCPTVAQDLTPANYSWTGICARHLRLPYRTASLHLVSNIPWLPNPATLLHLICPWHVQEVTKFLALFFLAWDRSQSHSCCQGQGLANYNLKLLTLSPVACVFFITATSSCRTAVVFWQSCSHRWTPSTQVSTSTSCCWFQVVSSWVSEVFYIQLNDFFL